VTDPSAEDLTIEAFSRKDIQCLIFDSPDIYLKPISTTTETCTFVLPSEAIIREPREAPTDPSKVSTTDPSKVTTKDPKHTYVDPSEFFYEYPREY